jgi:hypothetical protein
MQNILISDIQRILWHTEERLYKQGMSYTFKSARNTKTLIQNVMYAVRYTRFLNITFAVGFGEQAAWYQMFGGRGPSSGI